MVPWPHCPEAKWCRTAARLVIAAMREPTRDMHNAGHRKLALDWNMADGRIPPDIWVTMIDEALK